MDPLPISSGLRQKLTRVEVKMRTYARQLLRLRKPLATLRLLKAAIRGRTIGSLRLRTIEFSLGYGCNYHCRHCYNTRLIKKARQMTAEDYVRVAREAMALGAVTFNFEGGETLIYHEQMLKILPQCHPEQNDISITTNGSYLTKDMARALKSAGVDCVRISIDSGLASEHDKFRGKQGSFEACLTAVDASLAAGLFVIINTVISSDSIRSPGLIHLLEYSHQRKIPLHGILAAPSGRWEGNTAILLEKDDFIILDDLRSRYPYFYNHIDTSTHRRHGCPAGRDSLYITPYGEVLGCAYLHISEGNVLDTSLPRIYARIATHPFFSNYPDKCLISEDREFIDEYLRLVTASDKPMPLGPEAWDQLARAKVQSEGDGPRS